MNRKWIVPLILVIFALIALPMAVSAEGLYSQPPVGKGNIKVGPLEIHPSVGVTGTYTDNVYQSYDGKETESSFITTVSPGVQFILPFGGTHNVQAGYLADINKFSDFSENDYVRQSANASMNLDFPGGLQFSLSDVFVDSEILRKWKEQPGLEGRNDPYRAKPYQANDLLAKAKYKFADRWAAALWYDFYKYEYDHDYDKDGNFDRHLGGTSLFYRFSPKTDALIEYQYSTVKYPDNRFYDNKNHTIYTGVGFDPSAKINGYAKVGWTQKKYDEKLAGQDDEFNEFSTQIDLGYNITPFDVVNFRGIRVIEEDSDTNAPFTRTDVSIGYSHVMSMNNKIRPYARLGFAKHEFDGWATDVNGVRKQRDDEVLYATLGVDYAMQHWLMWTLGYTYRNQDSNMIRYDYDENRVFLNATVAF